MRHAVSALASLVIATGATVAVADTHMTEGPMGGVVSADNMENLIRTRDITGGDIYTLNEAYDEGSWLDTDYYDAVGTDWNEIGEIEDIVLSRDGKVIGIVAEVGGFLDIADEHVLIRLDDVKLVASDDGEYAYVTRMSEEELEAMPDVDEGWWN